MHDWHIALTLGLLLAAALLGGLAGEILRLPKVTAYLLIGVLVGPTVLDVIPHEHIKILDPLTQLAMALVLFNLGCSFSFSQVRRIYHRVLPLSFWEAGTTFVLVTCGLLLVGAKSETALLLGALAMATAPATTILVLKESKSEGPLTRYTESLVALNNVASIVVFELLFVAIHFLQGRLVEPVHIEVGRLLTDVFGSVFLGILAGLLASYICALLSPGRWLVLMVAVMTLMLGTCQTLDIPYMLAFLAMGCVVANSSEKAKQIVAELDRLTGFLCVLFFVIHGAELELHKFVEAGAIGTVYIVTRLAGKYFGIFFSARREEPEVRRWLGTALTAQAGAAIALSAILVGRDPELGIPIQNIILGSVVFFEIAGPLLVRHAVVEAGEVPLIHAVHHSSVDPIEELRELWNRILVSLGRNPLLQRSTEEITVQQLMRKNIKGIPDTATFNEVISHIEHTHDDTYPVVGSKGELIGVIRYHELSNTLFDPHLGALVRAADLATFTDRILYPDESAKRAWDMLRSSPDDCVPVVSREERNRLEGVVRRRDLVHLFIKGQQGDQGNSSAH